MQKEASAHRLGAVGLTSTSMCPRQCQEAQGAWRKRTVRLWEGKNSGKLRVLWSLSRAALLPVQASKWKGRTDRRASWTCKLLFWSLLQQNRRGVDALRQCCWPGNIQHLRPRTSGHRLGGDVWMLEPTGEGPLWILERQKI